MCERFKGQQSVILQNLRSIIAVPLNARGQTIGAVYVNFTIGDNFVEVEAQVETVDRTGVEMEALTACTVAALTIYDMCKSADRSMSVGELALWEKTGGSVGTWRRPAL